MGRSFQIAVTRESLSQWLLVWDLRDGQHLTREGRRYFYWWVKCQEWKHRMGNNSVCWGSGDSSSLVQRFLSMVYKRELRQCFCPMIPFQKKMSALQFLFSMQLDKTWCLSLPQASCFHVLSDVTKEFHFTKRIHFRTHLGNCKECQHLQHALLSKKHSNGRKQWLLPESRCAPVMSGTYDFSCFDEDRKATHHCALLLSISAAVTSFHRGIAKKSEQNLMFFSTRQKFAAFPEVLIELEGKGNNVS